jgi:hypothetical protein
VSQDWVSKAHRFTISKDGEVMKSKTEEREIRLMEVISVREMDLDRSHSELPVHKFAVSQMVL